MIRQFSGTNTKHLLTRILKARSRIDSRNEIAESVRMDAEALAQKIESTNAHDFEQLQGDEEIFKNLVLSRNSLGEIYADEEGNQYLIRLDSNRNLTIEEFVEIGYAPTVQQED